MALDQVRCLCVMAFALTALNGSAIAAGLPPVTTNEIAAGVRSCVAATTAAGLDIRKLKADGWRRGTMSSNGKAVQGPIAVYGRNGLLMMRDEQANRPICMFSARIASAGDFPKLEASMAAAYGAPVRDDGRGEQIFFTADKHIVDLASTGSTEQPAVRIAVSFVTQETK